MSRYSPSVLPTTPNWSGLVDAFNDSYSQGLKRKQDKQRSDDEHQDSVIKRILQGERTGKPPAASEGEPMDETPRSSVVPPDSEFSRALGVAAPALGTPVDRNAVNDQTALGVGASGTPSPVPAGNTFSQAFQAKAPTAAARGAQPVDARSSGLRGTMTPGAFDPSTGTFATAHGLPVGGERYVEIDPSHYVDTLAGSGFTKALLEAQSRASIAEENLLSRERVAADRDETARDVGAGHDTTRKEEGDANRGTRATEGDKNRAAALARVEVQATAAANWQREHDRSTGSRALTGNAQAAWAKTMADGIVGVHGGSMDASMAYFNSDEAKPYRDKGLTAQDIYAAAGRAMGVVEKEVVGKTPTAATAKRAPADVMGARAAADSAMAGSKGQPPKKKQITADQRDYLKTVKKMSDKEIDALYEVTGAPPKP